MYDYVPRAAQEDGVSLEVRRVGTLPSWGRVLESVRRSVASVIEQRVACNARRHRWRYCPRVSLNRGAVLVSIRGMRCISAGFLQTRRVGGCMRGLRSVAGTVVAAALLAAAAPRIAWGDVRTATHDDAPPEPRPFDLLA